MEGFPMMHALKLTRRWTSLAALLAAVAVAAPAWAGAPTDQLRTSIDQVIKMLEDPSLKGEAKAADRRKAVRAIASDIFDFSEMARRSLARHWKGLNERDRQEFVALFTDLLERSYFSRIESYGGERIAYANEQSEGDIATVNTRIVTKNGTEVPVDYRMLKRGDRWRVYDVNIEGVSLIGNYRTQFNKIIQTSSYAELIKRMKTKQGEVGS
jgi:phospholipid transport system substrate-binding protein